LYLRGATMRGGGGGISRLQFASGRQQGQTYSSRPRAERPYMLGVPPIDIVRKQAVIRGWTWRKLDKAAKTGRYFQQTTRRVDWDHLAKAIEILGGTIEFRMAVP